MQKPVFNPKLAQVAVSVDDIEEARVKFARLLGCEPPEVLTTKKGSLVDLVYRGQPSDSQAKLAFFDLGGVQLELIEAVGEESAWSEGFRARGEHVHHLAFWTEDLRAATEHMEEHGAPLVMQGDFEDGSGTYAYFDGVQQFGFYVELLEKSAEHR